MSNRHLENSLFNQIFIFSTEFFKIMVKILKSNALSRFEKYNLRFYRNNQSQISSSEMHQIVENYLTTIYCLRIKISKFQQNQSYFLLTITIFENKIFIQFFYLCCPVKKICQRWYRFYLLLFVKCGVVCFVSNVSIVINAFEFQFIYLFCLKLLSQVLA